MTDDGGPSVSPAGAIMTLGKLRGIEALRATKSEHE